MMNHPEVFHGRKTLLRRPGKPIVESIVMRFFMRGIDTKSRFIELEVLQRRLHHCIILFSCHLTQSDASEASRKNYPSRGSIRDGLSGIGDGEYG
jgi:hypothetical protein